MNIIFGRYTNFNSVVHRIDARVKIALLIILIVPIFFRFKVPSTSIIMSVILLIVFLFVIFISKTKVKTILRSVASMWFLLVFLLIVYIFVPISDPVIGVMFTAGNWTVYWDSLYDCLYIYLRLMLIICIAMILTSTTKNTDLTYGFEWYMAPLKVVKFPSHAIAMTLSIALRFIPTIIEEAQRILKAQESRGIDFSHGGLGKRFTAIIALIIPLFNSAFTRSDELAHAMEARGYDPKAKRSRYQKYPLHWVDLYATIFVLAVFGIYLYLFIAHRDMSIVNLIAGYDLLHW